MTTHIRTEGDLEKLLAFLKVQAKGEFEFPIQMAEKVLEHLKRFANDNHITVALKNPSHERILAFTAGGAIAGAAIGAMIASMPGACLGLVAGGLVGFSAAHIEIVWDLKENKGRLILV
jgi:hypothetical protein